MDGNRRDKDKFRNSISISIEFIFIEKIYLNPYIQT